jgi:hypothetical protein
MTASATLASASAINSDNALCALKIHRKGSNGVAQSAPQGGKVMLTQGPSCASPTPQLKRERSMGSEFGWLHSCIRAIFQRDILARHL